MGVWHAAHAGLYAAMAGLTGKFAASYSEAHWLCLVVSKFLMFTGAVQPQLGFCDEVGRGRRSGVSVIAGVGEGDVGMERNSRP